MDKEKYVDKLLKNYFLSDYWRPIYVSINQQINSKFTIKLEFESFDNLSYDFLKFLSEQFNTKNINLMTSPGFRGSEVTPAENDNYFIYIKNVDEKVFPNA